MALCSGCYREAPVFPNPLGFGKPRCSECAVVQDRVSGLLGEMWALGVPRERTNAIVGWMAWEGRLVQRPCRKCGTSHSGRGADPHVCLACEQSAAVDRIGELKQEAQGG